MEWSRVFLGLEPVWQHEPSLDTIRKFVARRLNVDDHTSVTASFLGGGLLNKVYKVEQADASESTCALRVVLPIHPGFKLMSEVATMVFLRDRIPDVSIPRVKAYQNSIENELGYEWMLMDYIAGDTLLMRWRQLATASKVELVESLAKMQYQLTLPQNHFAEIGSLFQVTSGPADNISTSFGLGHSQSLDFWFRESANPEARFGPFGTISSWLKARITSSRIEHQHIISTSDDEDDIDVAEYSIKLGKKIEQSISAAFPFKEDQVVPTVVQHPDLNDTNIMLDKQGQLMSIIDWESTTTVPLPLAFRMPSVLRGKDRFTEPKRDEYADYDDTCFAAGDTPADLRNNDGKDDMYWEHLEEYEKTKLRVVYIEQMRRLTPQYDALTKQRLKLEDWDGVVTALDNDLALPAVSRWIVAREQGRQLSYDEALDEIESEDLRVVE